MKNLLIALCLLSTLSLFGQIDYSAKKNEIKFNLATLVLGNPEIAFEHIVSPYSGLGLYANFNIDNNRINSYDFMSGFYYRLYVSGKDATGFFIEPALSILKESYTEYNLNNSMKSVGIWGGGPSLALGGKLLIKEKIVMEFYGGVGRNFSDDDYLSFGFPRFGVSLGTRF